jgi:hypothetical protein
VDPPYTIINSNVTTIPIASKLVIQGFKITTGSDIVTAIISVYAEQGATYWSTVVRARHTGGSTTSEYTIYYYGLS